MARVHLNAHHLAIGIDTTSISSRSFNSLAITSPGHGCTSPLNTMDLPDIEAVASEVHLEWMKSKRDMGVLSRKAEDGEELMVPFEQLSEKAKELDRRVVRTVYGAIERALNAGAPSEYRLTSRSSGQEQ